jgi:HEAT repeat protein
VDKRRHHCAAIVLALTITAFSRPAASNPPADLATRLTIDIRQRDSAERRAKALGEVREMLKGDAAAQTAVLTAVAGAADVSFDRSGLEERVAGLFSSPSPAVRRAALLALPTVGPKASRLDEAAKLAADADPRVRSAVLHAFAFIRRANRIETPIGEPALTLLNDSEKNVVIETAGSLWGEPLAADVEEKVIALSRFPDGQVPERKSVPYWMNYYVLSTRPLLSKPVARRLAEIARHPQLDQNWTGRAIWGLAHTCAPEAADVVTKALIEELDNSLNSYNREWAVRGLAGVRTEAAMKKLADIATGDDSESLRGLASSVLRRP